MNVGGATVRRAFSISSSDSIQNMVSISMRESKNGVLSPLFWEKDLTGTHIELMGPLGVNTGDAMYAPSAYLFAYGVGAGVVKSILDHLIRNGTKKRIVVMTGSRAENEILHREYFDSVAKNYPSVEVRHVLSQPEEGSGFRKGYIQDHLDGIDFNSSDVYACGQEIACTSLVEKISAQKPKHCTFIVEAFH